VLSGQSQIAEQFLTDGSFRVAGGIFRTGELAVLEGEAIQSGGIVDANGVDIWPYCLYEIGGVAELVAEAAWVHGSFTQLGGTVTIDTVLDVQSTYWIDKTDKATYELKAGELQIGKEMNISGDADGPLYASFSMPDCPSPFCGRVVGLNDDSRIYVNGRLAELLGPVVFSNLSVAYRSDPMDRIWGHVYPYNAVISTFDGECLTVGGRYLVTHITPADFADGNVPNVLASSVFDVNFNGSFCGRFTITMPYVEADYDPLVVDEADFVILHETGPGTYEVLTNVVVDDVNDIISAQAHAFGKFAVASVGLSPIGDFCGPNFGPADGYVDVWDLMQFSDHWHTRTGDGNWDAQFDLAGPNFADPDGYIDVWDLMTFADHWHEGEPP